MSLPRTPPLVLTFAAFDPTGGAGVQADVLTIAALGAHPVSVLTGLTVQDTRGVSRMKAVEADWVAAQARAVLADMPVQAIKVGVLGSRANAAVVGELLAEYRDVPVVLDPVLASGRGDALAEDDVPSALRDHLLPRCTVVTPNSVEARRLAGREDLDACADALRRTGTKYVLITGTHEATDDVVNVLHGPEGRRAQAWPRLAASYHGSGCTLASALACGLARGLSVEEASRQAQQFTWHALEAGFSPGRGQHLPNRFFNASRGLS